jgi:release factor glutamine methyltransferase
VTVSLSSFLSSVEKSLSLAGIASARTEAELLAGYALGLSRTNLHLEAARGLSPDEESRIMELVGRRLMRYPLQYITGECEFLSRAFAVHEGVFIPRPETEVLVESIARRAGEGGPPLSMLEVGAGTGVVSVSLAREMHFRRIVCTDISPLAALNTRENALRHGVESLMHIVVGDGISFLGCGCAAGRDRGGDGRLGGACFDLFVCNPPYIAAREIEELEPEVREYEPRVALDGGEDGLSFVRRIFSDLPSILSRGAMVALEIGEDQAGRVSALLRGSGGRGVEVVKDLSGRNRVVTARMG